MGNSKSKSEQKRNKSNRNEYTSNLTKLETSSSSSSSSSSLPSSSLPSSTNSSSNNEAEVLANSLLKLLEKLEELSNAAKTSSDKHSCTCDCCKKSDFSEYRYKCLVCDDYDLCGSCFEKRNINGNHALSHPLVRFDLPDELFGLQFENSEINLSNFIKIFKNEIHEGVKCDNCSNNPIRGLRLKCDTCHDYDLCVDCFKDKKSSKLFYILVSSYCSQSAKFLCNLMVLCMNEYVLIILHIFS